MRIFFLAWMFRGMALLMLFAGLKDQTVSFHEFAGFVCPVAVIAIGFADFMEKLDNSEASGKREER